MYARHSSQAHAIHNWGATTDPTSGCAATLTLEKSRGMADHGPEAAASCSWFAPRGAFCTANTPEADCSNVTLPGFTAVLAPTLINSR